MSSLKPILMYASERGPNPIKVQFVMDTLKIPYKIEKTAYDQLKVSPYIDICSNGRLPTIVDPNYGGADGKGLTLWESGAIIEYLVERYDTARQISFEPGTTDFYLAKQWLHFQMSEQGPYFGQVVYFSRTHSEKVESVVVRFQEQVLRVVGVLDRALTGKEWLVGDKLSYVDIAHIPWQFNVKLLLAEHPEKEGLAAKYPNYAAWHNRIIGRPEYHETMEMYKATMGSVSSESPLFTIV